LPGRSNSAGQSSNISGRPSAFAGEQAGGRQARGQRRDFGQLGGLRKSLEHGRVGRYQDANVVPGPVQGGGQGCCDITETTGFDPGGHFGGGEKDGEAAHQVINAVVKG
jgi:hypothetical protein